ncbi:hypothetical protein N656DRAFT_755022 [Canariomyces notabilis]|uniref:RecQ-mediated genome instability protein 1 n=1 Tax=Canariomyces notabilis TaxID=2074819 RepID=A0AAN6YQN1_9PEZI|nr:hypothetical protein N656DRAFT_755022 [Canariomyces arenarius]
METARHLQTSLSSQSIPTPSLQWLSDLVSSRSQRTTAPPPPLASLLATARARLLAADLTTPGLLDAGYASAHALPEGLQLSGVTRRESRLPHDVVVQVLDLEDVSRSRWEQVEELEAIQRGEGTRGREVIRLPEQRQQRQGQSAGGKNSTHKLVVQDCKGQKAYALELKRVDRIAVGKTSIGEKILLKAGTTVARGVLMLEPGQCVVLGGKVEAWHRAWVDGRLARLKEAAAADGAESG